MTRLPCSNRSHALGMFGRRRVFDDRLVTIQQKAGQIAALLLRVQSEFVKYGKAVDVAKKRAESTVKAMNKLSTRQRVMGRTLRGVSTIEGVATEVPSGEHSFLPIEMNDLVDDEEEVADTDDLDEADAEGEAQTQS